MRLLLSPGSFVRLGNGPSGASSVSSGTLPGHVRGAGREKHSGADAGISAGACFQRSESEAPGHSAPQPASLRLHQSVHPAPAPGPVGGTSPGCFDLILADAPCSGQSLLAKGIPNPGCFNSSVTGGNAKRQRGILLAALRCLAPGGFLLYTTCTYAPEENERNVLYLLKRHPDLHTVTVPELEHFRSSLTQEACYRLMPFHGAGAGGFTCLLRKEGGHPLPLSLPDELKAWPIHAMNC
ncbi:hypothetical protein M5E88_00945 [Akkermansia muciniphila]|nr:hypothetical protein M5E88_00945 [Akkermansia muciniphila]